MKWRKNSIKKALGLGETNTLVDEHEQTDENQTLFSDSGGDCFALGFWDHIKGERQDNLDRKCLVVLPLSRRSPACTL
jgi:hypothetical protein